jgi:hypothetical protein
MLFPFEIAHRQIAKDCCIRSQYKEGLQRREQPLHCPLECIYRCAKRRPVAGIEQHGRHQRARYPQAAEEKQRKEQKSPNPVRHRVISDKRGDAKSHGEQRSNGKYIGQQKPQEILWELKAESGYSGCGQDD